MKRQIIAFLIGLIWAIVPTLVHAQDVPPLTDANAYLPSTTVEYRVPALGIVTSGYGMRWDRMHHGIDIAASVGTPIYAAANGTVEYAEFNNGGYGNMVEIRHSDGSLTRYAHLDRILVNRAARVHQLDIIGEMGSTGYSTGPHLHFELHRPDVGAVNPIAYLENLRVAQHE